MNGDKRKLLRNVIIIKKMKRKTGAFNAKENQIVISSNDIMIKIVLMHSFIHFTVHIYFVYCYCIHLLYCSLKKPFLGVFNKVTITITNEAVATFKVP